MAYSKAANRAGVAHEAKVDSAITACREDDARSTSASSMHGDGGSDIHAISSDEEHDTAMNQSEVMQHRNMLANAPWRREEQQQRQKQKQKQCVVNLCKVGQPCAPPGLPLPATAVGGKAAFAALQAPAFRPPPGLPPPDLRPPPGFVELPPGLPLPEVRPITGAENHNSEGAPVIFKYTAQAFRRELAKIMRELRLHKKIGFVSGPGADLWCSTGASSSRICRHLDAFCRRVTWTCSADLHGLCGWSHQGFRKIGVHRRFADVLRRSVP